jgi:hypothetical protein
MHKRPAKGSVYEVIGEALDAVGPRKIVAGLLDVGTSKAHAWSDPDQGVGRAPLSYGEARSVAREFPDTAGLVFARDMATMAGGVFLPPMPEIGCAKIAAAFGKFTRESAEATAELFADLSDGNLDRDEADRACRELDDVIAAAIALRGAVLAALVAGERLENGGDGT